MEQLVVVEEVRKRFGTFEALRGVDFEVATGSIFGLLGPNGAGKTTMLRVLSTLLMPDEGHASIAGLDVVRDAAKVRSLIGLAGQHAAMDEKLTGYENLLMFGRLYHLPERLARQRAHDLLDRYDLADASKRLVSRYSGGMRRRLDLITSLIVAPRLLFLDEPTTGLDPRSRNEIWETIRQLVSDGTTLLLTTQYLDEADQLADQIAIVDQGTVVAGGTPAQLKSTIGTRVEVTLAVPDDGSEARRALSSITAAETEVEANGEGRRISAPIPMDLTLPDLVRQLDLLGIRAVDIAVHQPSLDEVFLRLTGRPSVHLTEPTVESALERSAAA